MTHKRPQESPWKIISSLDATVADWVGPSFYLQGPHLQRLGFCVPLYGELEEEIGKRAFHDVIGRICMSPTLSVFEVALVRVLSTQPLRPFPSLTRRTRLITSIMLSFLTFGTYILVFVYAGPFNDLEPCRG